MALFFFPLGTFSYVCALRLRKLNSPQPRSPLNRHCTYVQHALLLRRCLWPSNAHARRRAHENQTALQEAMRYHARLAALTTAQRVPYVLCETNRFACKGLTGVSNVFGAALWAIDYAVNAAAAAATVAVSPGEGAQLRAYPVG